MNFTQTSKQLTLSHGILRVRKDTDTTWQDLFHVKDVKVNIAADEIEHENVRKKLKVVDKTITTKMTAKGSFMCDVPIPDNVNLFLMGSGATQSTQTGGTWTAESFTVATPDKWQELGKRKIVMTAITDDTSTPIPLVEHVDYEADWLRGLFLPLSSSSLIGAALDVFKITGTYATHTKDIVAAAANGIQRHVWFAGESMSGRMMDVKGWCNLKPNGDLPYSSDEFVGFSFDMSFNAHEDYPDSPVGLYHEDLGEVVV